MEGCGNVEEVKAFRANLAEGAKKKGRDPSAVKVLLRLKRLRLARRQEGPRCLAPRHCPHAGRGPAEVHDRRKQA